MRHQRVLTVEYIIAHFDSRDVARCAIEESYLELPSSGFKGAGGVEMFVNEVAVEVERAEEESF